MTYLSNLIHELWPLSLEASVLTYDVLTQKFHCTFVHSYDKAIHCLNRFNFIFKLHATHNDLGLFVSALLFVSLSMCERLMICQRYPLFSCF